MGIWKIPTILRPRSAPPREASPSKASFHKVSKGGCWSSSGNFTAEFSRDGPRNKTTVENKMRFAALIAEQQRLPPTPSLLQLKTVKTQEHLHINQDLGSLLCRSHTYSRRRGEERWVSLESQQTQNWAIGWPWHREERIYRACYLKLIRKALSNSEFIQEKELMFWESSRQYYHKDCHLVHPAGTQLPAEG